MTISWSKICVFAVLSTPVSFEALTRVFRLWPMVRNLVLKLKSLGYPLDPTVISFESIPACDRRTNRQTNRQAISKSRICIMCGKMTMQRSLINVCAEFLFIIRDSESWYCFRRVCLSLCMSVCANEPKVVLETCLALWITFYT